MASSTANTRLLFGGGPETTNCASTGGPVSAAAGGSASITTRAGVTLRGDPKNKVERALRLLENGSEPMETYYYFHLPQRGMRVLVMRVDGRYWSATLVMDTDESIAKARSAFQECTRPSTGIPLLDYMGEFYCGIHLNHVHYLQHFPGRITPSVDALVSWIREYAEWISNAE